MKLEDTKEYKEYALIRKEKAKFIKRGDYVIHLHYYKHNISEPELLDYEQKIQEVGLELSHYDQEGDIYNNLEDFTLQTFIALNNSTVSSILQGTLSNLTWETLKYISLDFWKRVKSRTVTKIMPNGSKQASLSFGLKVTLDEHTELDFELRGNVSEKTILQSLDKSIKLIREHKRNQNYKHPYFIKYDEHLELWESIDVEEELRRRHSK